MVGLPNYLQYKYKKRNALIPTLNDEAKTPRQNWCLGRIIELVWSKEKQIRSAKVLLGRTGKVVERPISKLYPIEFANEFSDDEEISTNNVEIIKDKDDTVISLIYASSNYCEYVMID